MDGLIIQLLAMTTASSAAERNYGRMSWAIASDGAGTRLKGFERYRLFKQLLGNTAMLGLVCFKFSASMLPVSGSALSEYE